MIGATVSALQGHTTWEYLVWGLPIALAVASAWTQFILSTTPAELHLREGQCAIQSIHDVIHENSPDWTPLYDIRESTGQVELFLGWTAYVFRRGDWPNFVDLQSTVRRTITEGRDVNSSSSVSV